MNKAGGMSGEIQGRKILLCVTGGIAAYKVAYVARELTQLGADVRVVMTRSAQEFIGAQTFAALTNNPVLTQLFDAGPDAAHVELARGAELAVVAPATANALSKVANGVADDLFSATMLMVRCPVLIAPAMHTEMWEHEATQENVNRLRQRGITFVGPAVGELSSGDFGPGRMVEPEEIVAACREVLGRSRALEGRRILVTAGGTQEPIDPVRFIGNRSSGLMGFAIAKAALVRGAKVTFVAGAISSPVPSGVDLITVRTADEMREAVLNAAPDMDVIVKAGAVADFKPIAAAEKKLKKAAGPPEIKLVPTPDILAELGAAPELRKPGGILVGFAAETQPDPKGLAELARLKLDSKKADLIVANDVASSDSGFGVRTNRAVIASADGVTDLGLVTKDALAEALMDRIATLLEEKKL